MKLLLSFLFITVSVFPVLSQSNSNEEFSSEKYQQQIIESISLPNANDNIIRTYYLSDSSLVEGKYNKEDMVNVLQKICAQKKARTYRNNRIETNLTSEETIDYMLNKLTPDNFIVLVEHEGLKEVRLYRFLYNK